MIPIAKPLIGKAEQNAVLRVLKSGKLVQGEKVEEFEINFSDYIGTKYAVAIDNGTSALIVALLSADIGPGDEVITTPFTFIATANSIVFTGAKPVFVDVEPDTYNIDPSQIEKAITRKTKAIMPVHIYGLMANMSRINRIARKHGLAVIEDSAQAHGAKIKTNKAGSWGLAGCFSFYPSKNMTTGEGGIITTNNRKIAQMARVIRNQGMKQQYEHDVVGYNFRMTDIAATIGIEQLKKLEGFTKRRIHNARYLDRKLEGVVGIVTPFVPNDYRHVYHQYTLRVAAEFPLSRDQLLKSLIDNGVGARIYYPKLLSSEKIFSVPKEGNLNQAQKLHSQIISIPIHPSLSKRDLDKMIEVIKNV